MNEKVKTIKLNGNGKVVKIITDKNEHEGDYFILSGGVIGTCKILLDLKDDLKKKEKVMQSLEKVGGEIKDHPNLRVNVLTNQNIGSLNEIDSSILKKIAIMFQHICGISTLMKGTGASSGIHLDLDKDGIIDTRIQIVNFTESGRHGSDGKYFSEKPGFSLSISPIITQSKGKIYKDNKGLRVDPNYCSSKKDIILLKNALQFCLDILNSKPISDIVLKIDKENEIISDPENYIMNNFYSGHHLIGGVQNCIDSNFKILELDNVYVCDASILENYVASNIHSTVVIMADLFFKTFFKKCLVKFLYFFL